MREVEVVSLKGGGAVALGKDDLFFYFRLSGWSAASKIAGDAEE